MVDPMRYGYGAEVGDRIRITGEKHPFRGMTGRVDGEANLTGGGVILVSLDHPNEWTVEVRRYECEVVEGEEPRSLKDFAYRKQRDMG